MRFDVTRKRYARMLLLFAVLAVAVLPGAKCHKEPAPQYTCGPSSKVPVVPGSGVSGWTFGSFPYDPGLFAGDLFAQINLFRTSRHIPSLQWHDGLALVAQKRAQDMNTRKYLSLVSPEGVTMCEMLVSSNPPINFDAAYDFVGFTQFPTGMFTSMVNDPSAETVMLDPRMTDFGASFQANPGPYYVAAIFAQNATR